MPIQNLQDAFAFFTVPQNCIDYVVKLRWPDGKVACPTCGSEAVTWMPSRSVFQCKGTHAKRQFSVKVGTIFESSPIALGKWLLMSWMLTNCRNGISSYEVARTIGITQKSAWFMLHRLRKGMESPSLVLQGHIEADECYFGGQPKNKHVGKRKQEDKTPIFGAVERGGLVVARVLPSATKAQIFPIIAASVQDKSKVYTDNAAVYDHLRWMGKSLKHQVINHSLGEYVIGRVHTNTIENFWSVLKRMLKGTYIHVTTKHLQAYVTEQAFRHNCRFGFVSEERRFALALAGTNGKRLTYKELTAGAA